MEEITGGVFSIDAFDHFLTEWQSILGRRIEQTIEAISEIDGIVGLILAGSGGRNALWPLSDIDLLPIFEGSDLHAHDEEIDAARNRLMTPWLAEGWTSGIDIGRIRFSVDELESTVSSSISDLIQNDSWFYGLDKGYQSRTVYDPTGLAATLSQRLSDSRFDPEIVRFRLDRFRERALETAEHYLQEVEASRFITATSALRATTQWMYIWRLESWGERDNSLARVGTRFEHLARERGRDDLVVAYRLLTHLTDDEVEYRMSEAPAWVHDRHRCSIAARQEIGETTTEIEDARDVLRVSSTYELRHPQRSPLPAWLAIATKPEEISAQTALLEGTLQTWFD